MKAGPSAGRYLPACLPAAGRACPAHARARTTPGCTCGNAWPRQKPRGEVRRGFRVKQDKNKEVLHRETC